MIKTYKIGCKSEKTRTALIYPLYIRTHLVKIVVPSDPDYILGLQVDGEVAGDGDGDDERGADPEGAVQVGTVPLHHVTEEGPRGPRRHAGQNALFDVAL